MSESSDDLSHSFIDEDEVDLINLSKAVDGVDPPHQEHLNVLLKIFGHKEFRPMQWKIISSIINDRRDNCAIMATGYGKSLCYQFPSVYCGGVTIVISPLISLMEDQVLSLTVSNISSCLLGTAQTQQKKVVQDILDNKYSLVYATPEFCCGDYGKQLLIEMDSKLMITLIAIDEAHCISSWGHDFRHQYRELATIRSVLPHIPILAVTATATQRVRKDIISSLKLRNPQIICSGFDRPNLYFSVQLKGNAGIIPDLRKVMVRQDGDWVFTGPTIVYCITRKHTDQVADLLKSRGIKCLAYHAGMTTKQRKETHEKFVRDKITVIVATVAFGMGIDKPDVRNIVHYGASRDIESYYQEVGRAGRDGQRAKCTIFYSSADFEILRTLREYGYGSEKTKQQKEAMTQLFVKYLETSGCRRQFILQHFEGKNQNHLKPNLNCCDNCTKKLQQKVPEEYEEVDANGLMDITEYAHTLLSAIRTIGENRGLQSYILFIRGSKSTRMPEKYQNHALHGSGKHKSEDWWKSIARLLERDKYFEKNTVNTPAYSYCTVRLGKKGKKFLEDIVNQKNKTSILIEPPPDLRLLLKKKIPKPPDPAKSYVSTSANSNNVNDWKLQKKTFRHSTDETITEDEVQKEQRMSIYRKLLAKRTELAYSLDCMPYMIASNEALMNFAQLKPKSLSQLRQCKLDGFTEAKINKFGIEFINVILPLCPPEEKRSIKDILAQHPLPDTKITPTAEVSYRMYKSAMSVDQVAKERNLSNATVYYHLVNCMKMGFPVKLIEFNVTTQIKNKIISIRNAIPASETKSLTTIKELCPAEITFDQIKAVMTYLEIRDHVKKFCRDYEEFDEDSETNCSQQDTVDDVVLVKECDTEKTSFSESSFDEEDLEKRFGTKESKSIELSNEDTALNALVEEIERGGYLEEVNQKHEKNEDVTSDDQGKEDMKCSINIADKNTEPPCKRQKFNLSLLDSPPRKFF